MKIGLGRSAALLQLIAVGSLALFAVHAVGGAKQGISVVVDWNNTIAISKTVPTMLICPEPLLRKGSPIHDRLFESVRDLGAKYVRYQLYVTYPGLSVAELEPPNKDTTFWDFSAIDSIVIPFLEATKGHEPILNFSTIPNWMFKTDTPIKYPNDPNKYAPDYGGGTELVDPTSQQVGNYYARIVSWYTKGGFTDENGRYHRSGYHYDLSWWGVLNEVDVEHDTTPEQYSARYDAIVTAIRRVNPTMKFVGMALGLPSFQPQFFEYFLNPKNHQPGIPLDMIAYHFYAGYFAGSSKHETLNEWQYTFFSQADGFLNTVRYIESIRDRLSPHTLVNLEELGTIVNRDLGLPSAEVRRIPPVYWNLSGALYAYLYIESARVGIDVAGESQLLPDAPQRNASVGMMDRTTGQPNARFRVLQLINRHFGLGDKLISTEIGDWTAFGAPFGVAADVTAQAFKTPRGKRLLAVNKRAVAVDISTVGLGRIDRVEVVDVKTGDNPPRIDHPTGETLHLEPFAVAVLAMGN